MDAPKITFEDGAAYERMMGTWSRIAGELFVDWLRPPRGLHWVDVGCGNGAFTELLIERCAAARVEGVDPSEAQLSFARERRPNGVANFQRGDALALPFQHHSLDAAAMALVIFFVPDPPKAVAEMARVVKAGGIVSTYAWDIIGGGLPSVPFNQEFRAMGVPPAVIPHPEASTLEALQELWERAGLGAIETKAFAVRRTFDSFEEYWSINLLAPAASAVVARLTAAQIAELKERIRARVPSDASGRITYEARINAVKGVVR